MKLKDGFMTYNSNGEYMVVAAGEAAELFNGIIRNNKTADCIYSLLMTDTTEEEVVKAMAARFDAPEGVIAEDVHKIVVTLREKGFLDE